MSTFVVKSWSGDLATDPAFITALMARAKSASLAGAQKVVSIHLGYLVKWRTPPGFEYKDITSFADLISVKRVSVTGAEAWKWLQINYGYGPVSINLIGSGRKMKFPYNPGTRWSSYNRKTIDGGNGQRTGPLYTTETVNDRRIEARDMIGELSAYRRKDVYAAMAEAFK